IHLWPVEDPWDSVGRSSPRCCSLALRGLQHVRVTHAGASLEECIPWGGVMEVEMLKKTEPRKKGGVGG
ncbi:unnamed protein product, partial [Bubo scandiacus]